MINESKIEKVPMITIHPIDLSCLVYVVKRLNHKQIWPECAEIHNKKRKNTNITVFKRLFVAMVTEIKIILSDL